jgi:hypothetical protein
MIDEIIQQDGADAIPPGLEESKMIALVSYLRRLGTDISRTPDEQEPAAAQLAATAEREPDHVGN